MKKWLLLGGLGVAMVLALLALLALSAGRAPQEPPLNQLRETKAARGPDSAPAAGAVMPVELIDAPKPSAEAPTTGGDLATLDGFVDDSEPRGGKGGAMQDDDLEAAHNRPQAPEPVTLGLIAKPTPAGRYGIEATVLEGERAEFQGQADADGEFVDARKAANKVNAAAQAATEAAATAEANIDDARADDAKADAAHTDDDPRAAYGARPARGPAPIKQATVMHNGRGLATTRTTKPRRPTSGPPLRLPPLVPYDPDAGEPTATLPRMAYFENTYLGGNAAHLEQLRRLPAIRPHGEPWRATSLPPQAFDGPTSAGLSLSAAIDRGYIDQPGRVMLQVGLQGSARAGWRRPPLDIVAVIDPSALARPAQVVRTFGALIARLGPSDRLAVRRVGDTLPIVALASPETARRALLRDPQALIAPPTRAPAVAATLAETLTAAGADLDAAADSARIPGTGVVLLLVEGEDPPRAAAAAQAAHQLTTEGITVSVLEQVDGPFTPPGPWWAVAHAGHGGHHRIGHNKHPDTAVEAELDRLSRVVARLVRVNIRLAPGVRAIRVLGSRLLEAEEVRQVKAREKAVDARLSRTLGVSADRGDDDDGLQTVIPYFLGEDTHVILIELWVERAGPIADVSMRYKDMVRLDNGRAATHVEAPRLARAPGPVAAQVRQNAQGVAFAEALGNAALAARHGDASLDGWLQRAAALATDAADRRLVQVMTEGDLIGPRLGSALEVSARRRLGIGHALVARD